MTKSETLTLFRRLPTRMCACVAASEEELARLESQFPEQFRQIFTSVALPANAALPALPVTQSTVLVIEVNPGLPGSIGRIEQARSRYPDLPIIAAVENLDLSKVRTLMRLGIKDVVALPFNADELLPFRVSDAERRRKVDGARTRGPHAVSYGVFNSGRVRASADGGDKRTGLRAACPILQ